MKLKLIAYLWEGVRGPTPTVFSISQQRKNIRQIAAKNDAEILCEIIDKDGEGITKAIRMAHAKHATLALGKPVQNVRVTPYLRKALSKSGVKVLTVKDDTGFQQAAEASAGLRTKRALDAYQFIIEIVRQQKAAEKNMAEIAEHLNGLGHMTTAGQQFTRKNLHRIVSIFEREAA